MSLSLELMQLFETPLILAAMPDAQRVNDALRQVIMAERRRDPAGLGISSRLGWHSNRRMLEWGGSPVNQLITAIVEVAERHTVDIKAGEHPRYAWSPEVWANVSGPGASNQLRCHPGAFWAAVYYVDDGYGGSRDPALGGEIELEDPRYPMIAMEAPDLRFTYPGMGLADPEVAIRPAAGSLVMVPAWLRQGVRTYRGRGERISVAVNLTAVPLT